MLVLKRRAELLNALILAWVAPFELLEQ